MKFKIIMFIMLFFNSIKNNSMQKNELQIDNSKIAIIAFKPEYNWLFKNAITTDLTNKDISKIEKTLESLVLKYNNEQKKVFAIYLAKKTGGDLTLERLTINLLNYKRQYIAIKNEKGEKEVWINMFCRNSFGDWKKVIIDVSDGGNCYFNFKINLNTNKYYGLMFNGEA